MPKYINANEMMSDESEAYLNVMGQPLDNATRIVNQYVHIRLQRLLSDAPTVDVQEVRYCKFELVQDGKGVCSNCHRLDSIDKLAKYCRYCGAFIKWEDDNNG